MLPARTQKARPTLEEAKALFKQWRKEKKRRDPIPPVLWKAAVALATKHSINEVSKHLHLSYTELKARANNRKGVPFTPQPSAFIELDALSCSECTIELEKSTGERMRIKANCTVRDLVREFFS